MVVGALANIYTAFGIGELSGAGFGPNYTILMKLGFEFFAPRILDEMEKNGGEFETTKHWQSWQRQMKLYSDKVMAETLDSLLSVPQATLDAVNDKFNEFLGGITTTSQERTITGVPTNVRLDLGQGQRREGEGSQKQGSSLFERDQLAKRQKELDKLIKEAEAKFKKDSTVKPTRSQSSTKISPTFANSLSAGDLNRGGQRSRQTRSGLVQWTGTHLITFNGVSIINVYLWKGSWSKINSLSGSKPTFFQTANKIRSQMGSSYALQHGNKVWLISDGHVQGFK